MVRILNQISNRLRNTSATVPDSSKDEPPRYSRAAMDALSLSLNLFLIASILAVLLKHWLWIHARNSGAHHTPEEKARQRELNAQRFGQCVILILFELLPFLMQIAVYFFYLGVLILVISLGARLGISLGLDWLQLSKASRMQLFKVSLGLSTFTGIFLLISYGRRAFYVLSRDLACPRWARTMARVWNGAALGPEIVHVGISNCLFIHTSMVPKSLPIFIQLFSLPVEHPQLRIKSLEPWSHLSSLLPSMLMEIYLRSKFDLLPALRLCLVLSGQGQSEQPWVNKEAKRVYSTIKASTPLQNLYLHLLLSQFHIRSEDTDHWQDACRILRHLEYSEEHTSELLWLVDSIQLYTMEIKEDFTTRIVEFLRGVVIYLSKCTSDEHNGGLLRTATIMAAEWLISRQSSNNGNLPRRYILSRQDVHPGEGNQKMFVLVKNHRLSPSERFQCTISLYQDSRDRDSSSGSVIRTLLIPVMAIEGFAAEKAGNNISDAVPCIQRDDLQRSLEGLWELREGGFNQLELLRFVLAVVAPPSLPVGDTQSSTAILLLNEYLQQINGSPAQMTEKAFRFIGATLEHSLTTGTTKGELDLQLRDFRALDPWLSLHVDNILGRRSTPCVVNLERMMTLDSRVKAIVATKRLNLYLSSNIEPEPDILTLLVQSDDPVISLEAFGQGVNLLESPLTDESDDRKPGSPRPFTFALLEQAKRSYLISRFFDPQQSTSMCQTVWIMFTEDLFPRWELLPADWRHDIATALVAATEWMEKGQEILAKEVKRQRGIRASGKAKRSIGATVLALVNYGDIDRHWKRKVPLEARDERFQERLDACAQVYLRLFATAIEELGESAKPHTQHIVNFLVDIPDVLYNGGAIKRIQRVLGVSRRNSEFSK